MGYINLCSNSQEGCLIKYVVMKGVAKKQRNRKIHLKSIIEKLKEIYYGKKTCLCSDFSSTFLSAS